MPKPMTDARLAEIKQINDSEYHGLNKGEVRELLAEVERLKVEVKELKWEVEAATLDIEHLARADRVNGEELLALKAAASSWPWLPGGAQGAEWKGENIVEDVFLIATQTGVCYSHWLYRDQWKKILWYIPPSQIPLPSVSRGGAEVISPSSVMADEEHRFLCSEVDRLKSEVATLKAELAALKSAPSVVPMTDEEVKQTGDENVFLWGGEPIRLEAMPLSHAVEEAERHEKCAHLLRRYLANPGAAARLAKEGGR